MYSHTIWKVKPPETTQAWRTNHEKLLPFSSQEQYDEWLKMQGISAGAIMTFKQANNIASAVSYPVVVLVHDVNKELVGLEYASWSGWPKNLLISTVYSGTMGAGPMRWDDSKDLRHLEPNEVEWLLGNVELQDRIKKAYPNFQHVL